LRRPGDGRRPRLVLVVPLALVVLALGAFALWATSGSAAQPEARRALASDDVVTVMTDRWLTFRPTSVRASTGLIFYPGGRIDPRAYAPAARSVAAAGHLAVIVPMPLRLAVLGPNRAARVIKAFPEIERWAVGGHSLGGAMAARFAARHPGEVSGLVLWGSYPAEGDSLASSGLMVVSVYGTKDRLATLEEIEASRQLLPPDTQWVAIEGGNHSGFGWYGPQVGDGSATIEPEEQQRQAVEPTVDLLDRLGRPDGDR
jgi:hypothetical protein